MCKRGVRCVVSPMAPSSPRSREKDAGRCAVGQMVSSSQRSLEKDPSLAAGLVHGDALATQSRHIPSAFSAGRPACLRRSVTPKCIFSRASPSCEGYSFEK